MNISLLLEMAAEAFGDRIALGSADSAMSYDVLRSSVRRAVRFFAQFPFDNVVFIGLNSQALPLCLFAAAYSNRSFVPLNYRLTDIELAKLVQRAGPSIVIVDDDMIDRVSAPASNTPFFAATSNSCANSVSSRRRARPRPSKTKP